MVSPLEYIWPPIYFTLMIKETLKPLDFCFTYLDDIIIYSKPETQHLSHIGQVFNGILWKANIIH